MFIIYKSATHQITGPSSHIEGIEGGCYFVEESSKPQKREKLDLDWAGVIHEFSCQLINSQRPSCTEHHRLPNCTHLKYIKPTVRKPDPQ
jgi:hypothetical protein